MIKYSLLLIFGLTMCCLLAANGLINNNLLGRLGPLCEAPIRNNGETI